MTRLIKRPQKQRTKLIEKNEAKSPEWISKNDGKNGDGREIEALEWLPSMRQRDCWWCKKDGEQEVSSVWWHNFEGAEARMMVQRNTEPTHLGTGKQKSSCHMRGLGRSRKCSERRLRTLRTLTADCDAVKGLGARIAEEVEVVWTTRWTAGVNQIASPVSWPSYSPLTLALRLLLTAQPFGIKCGN